MNANGTDQTRLTSDPGKDGFPVWSPDGSRIAFQSDRDGNFEVYVMDADGSNVVRLTDDPAGDGFPDWSPDGSQIAFASNRDGNFEIYVMDAEIEYFGQADDIAIERQQRIWLLGGQNEDQAVDFYFCPSDGFKLWPK